MAYVSCRWEITKKIKGEKYTYSFVPLCNIGGCIMTFGSSLRGEVYCLLPCTDVGK